MGIFATQPMGSAPRIRHTHQHSIRWYSQREQIPTWTGLFHTIQRILQMPIILRAGNESACQAGRCTSASSKQEGQHKRSASTHNHQRKPCYDFTHDDKQMRCKLGLQAPNHWHPHPNANGIGNPSNKHLHKPDWHELGTCIEPVYGKVAFSTCFRSATKETTICCPMRPCYTLM